MRLFHNSTLWTILSAVSLMTASSGCAPDGVLIAWGSNVDGQTDVPTGNDFVAIASGSAHNLALKEDGSLEGWGFNGDGQADVPAGNDYIDIAAGSSHSLALRQMPPETTQLFDWRNFATSERLWQLGF